MAIESDQILGDLETQKIFTMKRFFFPVLSVAVISLFAFKPVAELPIGASIPNADVKMKDINGKEVSFADAKKKNGLLVMFSCNTCPVVKAYESRTVEVSKYALDKNVGVILLNSNEALRSDGDSYDEMKDYAKQLGYSWHYVVDENSKMADAFGANRTPEVFLFNAESKLVYHGAIDDNSRDASAVSRNHLKEAINEMTAGKDVAVKTTRSVGCTIKRKG